VSAKLPRPLWLTALAGLFLLLGALGYSGSSGLRSVTTCTLLVRQERAQHRELFGKSRLIRSDELAVELPKSRAQQLATPSFPLVNLDEGLGQLERNSYPIPVLDWGIVFRPLLWPLLTGSRWGFGPRWFLRSCLVLVGMVGWFRAVTARQGSSDTRERRRSHITALGALAVLFSTSVSWWLSTPITETLGFSGLGVAAARRTMVEDRPRRKVAWGISAWYLFTCAFFAFYPPIWAPMLWLISAGIIDCRWRTGPRRWRTLAAAVPLLVALGIAVAIGIAYYAPYLASVLHTAYPGERRVSSGGFALARLLTLTWPSVGILGSPRSPERYFGPDASANICEFSAIEVTPLFILLAVAVVRGPVRSAVLRAVKGNPVLLTAWLVLAAWLFLPIPEPFGTLALLRWTTPARAWFGFDLAAALLAVSILTELGAAVRSTARVSWRETAVAALTCAALFLPVWHHYEELVEPAMVVRYWGPMALAALLTLLGMALLRYRPGAALLALGWAVPLVAVNLGVNPLIKTADLLPVGQGHRVARAALDKAPGRVVDVSTHWASELGGEGFAILGGVYVAPDIDLFHFLAPESPGLTADAFNRYAHVRFVLRPQASGLGAFDLFNVAVSPCSRRLATLWVNHFLVLRSATIPSECAADFDIRDAGEGRWWSRKVPVNQVGVLFKGAPDSALKFDFRAPNRVSLTRERDGILLEAPPGSEPFATAVNLSLIDRIRCRGASASTIDAHVVVTPRGDEPVRCEVKFLGTRGGLARLAGVRKPFGRSQ
jgi:hypothetical protein